MFNHNESGGVLRLNWALTGDRFAPLRSSWSVYIPDETPAIGAPEVCEVCNATVIESCDTSFVRSRGVVHALSLAMCGK